MRNTFLFTILFFSALSVQAQTEHAKWGLGVYPSGISFYALDNNALTERAEYELSLIHI